jgi:hypothetical protein
MIFILEVVIVCVCGVDEDHEEWWKLQYIYKAGKGWHDCLNDK